MKKIPTLFEREYKDHNVVEIKDIVTPGMERILNGDGIATVKIDGSCTAIINGEFYKRYDAKQGKTPPEGAIPCCPPDKITGHWPHWVKVDRNNPADKWFWAAYDNTTIDIIGDWTFEAIGPHFQGNPYNIDMDVLVPHGMDIIKDSALDRSFAGIRSYLKYHAVEGIVFWIDQEPVCKIRRSDFGLMWPISPTDLAEELK